MNRDKEIREKHKRRQRLYISLMLLLLAFVAMTAATVAWFTIADRGRVDSMNMDVTAGTSLRFDLDSHDEFEEYTETLQFQQIAGRIQAEHGFNMKTVPLEPVTTGNGQNFRFEDGSAVSVRSGAYLEFRLHFMAMSDMDVHLTGKDGRNGKQGTKITSKNPKLAGAMRISFTADGRTYIYDPGKTAEMKLFSLEQEKDKEVIVRIWLEGTDENCTSDIQGSDYSISMRFVGTDENGKVIEE